MFPRYFLFFWLQCQRFRHRLHYAIILLLSIIGLTGCAAALGFPERSNDISGVLLVWHNWTEPEAQVIHDLLDDFMTIHPKVTVVSEYIPTAELDERFIEQMGAGLGPDLIIGAELPIIHELVSQDLLLDLSATGVTTDTLLGKSIQALTLDNHLYGVPFAAYTNVLYFNRTLVDKPAKTTDELMAAVDEGLPVAIPTDFYHAYWGIRAFGDGLINTDGQIVAESGLEPWLDWLLDVQERGALLSPEYVELRQFFAEGNAAYFIGDSSELPYLRRQLGEELVGVAVLPRVDREVDENDDIGTQVSNTLSPGAFLELEVMAVSKISAQKELSVKLIDFFVNQTHQREIAQADNGQIPLSRLVRFDPHFSPDESTLIRQSATTVIIPLEHIGVEQVLLDVGTDIYNKVLEGVLAPADAVELLRQEVNDRLENNKL